MKAVFLPSRIQPALHLQTQITYPAIWRIPRKKLTLHHHENQRPVNMRLLPALLTSVASVMAWISAIASGPLPVIMPSPAAIESRGPAVGRHPGAMTVTLRLPDSIPMPSASVAEEAIGHGVTLVRETPDTILPAEGYELRLDSAQAIVRASDYNGVIYALHTIGQIVASPESRARHIIVSDYPRCRWRSFMLDSGRQFHSPATVRKYIRMASALKMNRFHWHLTEGLGWRPEIDALPRLAKVGGFVGGGQGQQGFYTRAEMRDIVAYARERGVEIVPEIDMPGHAEAALKAYPSLACTDDSIVIPEAGFTDRIFCAGKDSTVRALKTIIDEICDIFPGRYIHLGGDEAPKGSWEKCPDCRRRMDSLGLADTHALQLWLSSEMARHLKRRGRKAVFWGDVIYSPGYGLPDNVAIQWWNYRGRRDLALRNALAAGHEVIASPNYYCYLNFPTEPWRGYGAERTFSLADAYSRNPADNAVTRGDSLILGIGCALWTDYNLTDDMLDSRLFPRIFALAELMWSSGTRLPPDEFAARLPAACRFFRSRGYDVAAEGL